MPTAAELANEKKALNTALAAILDAEKTAYIKEQAKLTQEKWQQKQEIRKTISIQKSRQELASFNEGANKLTEPPQGFETYLGEVLKVVASLLPLVRAIHHSRYFREVLREYGMDIENIIPQILDRMSSTEEPSASIESKLGNQLLEQSDQDSPAILDCLAHPEHYFTRSDAKALSPEYKQWFSRAIVYWAHTQGWKIDKIDDETHISVDDDAFNGNPDDAVYVLRREDDSLVNVRDLQTAWLDADEGIDACINRLTTPTLRM